MCVVIIVLLLAQKKSTSPGPAPSSDDNWELDPNSPAGQMMANALRADSNTKPCQTISDAYGSYGDYQGSATITDWSGFRVRQCTTKPTAFTSNTALMSQISGNQISGFNVKDPLMKEAGSITNGQFMANPIANNHFVVGSSRACIIPGVNTSSDSTQTVGWCTPAGSDSRSEYKFAFDTATANSGNLCLFNKTDTTKAPVWCALPQITLQTTATSTTSSGPGLADIQQQQLSAAKLKNRSDTNPRFAMLRDDGKLCMYKGTPGTPGENLWCSP
jgi:hypothetical protein